MSYRLIDSNEIAIKYPEVNEMDCIYVDLPNGLDNEYHRIDAEPVKHAHWIEGSDGWLRCSECGRRIRPMPKQDLGEFHKWCGRCGAIMDLAE